MPTGNGFFSADLPEKVDEFANLVDTSLSVKGRTASAFPRKRLVEL